MTDKTSTTPKISVDLVLIEPVKAFGGTERHTIELIHELQRKELRTAFIESGNPQVSSRIKTNRDILTIVTTELSMSPETRREFRAWTQLINQFKTDRALIIKPWNATGSTKFYELLKSRFKKIIVIEHTTVSARTKWSIHLHFNKRIRTSLWWYKNYYELKKRATLVDRIITVSNFNKSCLTKNTLVSAEKISVCPNGIDTNFWRKDVKKALEFRQKLNIPNDAFVFGCVGRLSPEKGFDLAISAFKEFQKHESARNSFLIIIGAGSMLSKLVHQARDTNKRILFTGFREELISAYSAMNAGLFTSHHDKYWSGESFGLSLIEAMSCECGVIAMNKSATAEVIGDCSNICELLETRDVDTWSLAMRRYVSASKDELEIRGAQLRKRVVENYDASITYARLVDNIMTV